MPTFSRSVTPPYYETMAAPRREAADAIKLLPNTEWVDVAGYPVLTGEQRQRPQSRLPLSCRDESMTVADLPLPEAETLICDWRAATGLYGIEWPHQEAV